MTLRGERRDRPTYRLLGEVDDRVSGALHLCDHEVLGRRCVQKTVDTLGREDALVFDEPRLLDQIDHPHVTPVREAQWDPDHEHMVTFVMPLYEGGSVADALREGQRFSIDATRRLIVHLLDALAYVHTRLGYLHRDVKPANVLLDGDRTNAFLADFGSAARLDADGHARAARVTLLYMPPEGGTIGRLGVPADLYSAGMVLYEMLNGRLEWERWASQVEVRLARGQRAVPDSALRFAPHVPPPLRTVVRKAVARHPQDRFQRASEFIRALNQVASVDWRHVDGVGLDGVWEGRWPPHLWPQRRDCYRVNSRVLQSGRGARRLVAQVRSPGGGWRRFGVPDATVGATDVKDVDRFFVQVHNRASQRSPAR